MRRGLFLWAWTRQPCWSDRLDPATADAAPAAADCHWLQIDSAGGAAQEGRCRPRRRPHGADSAGGGAAACRWAGGVKGGWVRRQWRSPSAPAMNTSPSPPSPPRSHRTHTRWSPRTPAQRACCRMRAVRGGHRARGVLLVGLSWVGAGVGGWWKGGPRPHQNSRAGPGRGNPPGDGVTADTYPSVDTARAPAQRRVECTVRAVVGGGARRRGKKGGDGAAGGACR